MRWISDKFDLKSMIIGMFMIVGFATIIFGLIDIFKMGLSLNFNQVAVTHLMYSHVAIVVMFIVGIYFMIGHMYMTSIKGDPNPNRTQLLYKMIMLLMIIGTSIINTEDVFKKEILSINSIYLIGVGCLIVAVYIVLRKLFLIGK